MVRLFLPVLTDTLEKAQRKSNLVKVTKTVTRDGATYLEGYWVTPDQAKADNLPAGAQMDLFDQAPPAPATAPAIPPYVYLSKQPTDSPDEVTKVFRTIAADMAAFPPGRDRPCETLEKEFRKVAMKKYGVNPNGISDFLDRSYALPYETKWKPVQDRLREIAQGEAGVYLYSFNAIIRSRYHTMPFDDIVRLYAGWVAESIKEQKKGHTPLYFKAQSLIAELRPVVPGVGDAATALDRVGVDGLKEVAAGTRSFIYGQGKSRKVFKAAIDPLANAPEVRPEDAVEQVKALVANGVSSLSDCMRIGKIVYDACGMSDNPAILRLQAIDEEKVKLYAEHKVRWAKCNRAVQYDYAPAGVFDNRGNVIDEEKFRKHRAKVDAIEKEYLEWSSTVYEPAIRALGDEKEALSRGLASNPLAAPAVMDFLKKIRPFGPAESMKGRLPPSADQARAALSAMSVFPTAWLDKVEGRRFILANSKAGNGKCVTRDGVHTIHAPWATGSTKFDLYTQAHELGHLVESANNLKELAAQFICSLADEENGGAIKNDRKHMRNWQKGLQSPLLPTQYAGVMYPDGSTEIVSTAAGHLYSDYDGGLFRGQRFWYFVLGLWAGV